MSFDIVKQFDSPAWLAEISEKLDRKMAFGAENGIALLWIKELHIEGTDIRDVELCAADGDGISHMVSAAVSQGKIKAVVYGLRFRFDAVETAFIHIVVEVLARHGDRFLLRAVREGVIHGFLIGRIQMDADMDFITSRTGVEVVAGLVRTINNELAHTE